MDDYIVPRWALIEYSDQRMFGMGDNAAGIYVLLFDDDIVYVGQAANIHDRLKSHAQTMKEWNRYYCIPVEDKQMRNSLESFYIAQHDPLYNIKKEKDSLADDLKALIDETMIPGQKTIILGRYGFMISYERPATEHLPAYSRKLNGKIRR